jgi:hypothetical protein
MGLALVVLAPMAFLAVYTVWCVYHAYFAKPPHTEPYRPRFGPAEEVAAAHRRAKPIDLKPLTNEEVQAIADSIGVPITAVLAAEVERFSKLQKWQK